jgi:hypothetical protein
MIQQIFLDFPKARRRFSVDKFEYRIRRQTEQGETAERVCGSFYQHLSSNVGRNLGNDIIIALAMPSSLWLKIRSVVSLVVFDLQIQHSQ